MLVDKLRIDFTAGRGGDGGVTFARVGRSLGKNGRLYYPQKGKPDGGNGGKGGDIYLEGSSDVYDLSAFTHERVFQAGDGGKGENLHKQGKAGRDLIIKVPLITVVTDTNGKSILSVKRHGERKLLVSGGVGGLGNYEFRQGQEATLSMHTPGETGESLKAFVELRLAADVIFIGFPNAGKSSLLNALTNANVKVASYPFTTLHPQLGVMAYKIKLMDLPGLIEGVAEGKGLGKSFSKHTIGAKLMAHFISLESDDMLRDYESIRKELTAFSPELSEKPEIILATKADMFSEVEIKEKIAPLTSLGKELYVISAYQEEPRNQIEKVFIKKVQELTHY